MGFEGLSPRSFIHFGESVASPSILLRSISKFYDQVLVIVNCRAKRSRFERHHLRPIFKACESLVKHSYMSYQRRFR